MVTEEGSGTAPEKLPATFDVKLSIVLFTTDRPGVTSVKASDMPSGGKSALITPEPDVNVRSGEPGLLAASVSAVPPRLPRTVSLKLAVGRK